MKIARKILKDDKGMGGIDTILIFFAILLLAVVTISLLFSTGGALQKKAANASKLATTASSEEERLNEYICSTQIGMVWDNSTKTCMPTGSTGTGLAVLTTISVTDAIVNVGTTQTMSATTEDQFGNSINVTVTWSSSIPAVGTIDANSGLFTGVAAGRTLITASNGNVSGTGLVTVI